MFASPAAHINPDNRARRAWSAIAILFVCALGVAALSLSGRLVHAAVSATPVPAAKSVYDFAPLNNSGVRVPLSRYKGDVLLIVNTASLCGNTPQYASLETLYQKYQGQGLRILAFPANNFASQEPGSNSQIKIFCTSKFHTTFDLFSKISVVGPDQAPLYAYLTSPATDPQFGKPIDWNFAKFLISRDGKIVNRFPAGHDPLLPDVTSAIEAELKKPS